MAGRITRTHIINHTAAMSVSIAFNLLRQALTCFASKESDCVIDPFGIANNPHDLDKMLFCLILGGMLINTIKQYGKTAPVERKSEHIIDRIHLSERKVPIQRTATTFQHTQNQTGTTIPSSSIPNEEKTPVTSEVPEISEVQMHTNRLQILIADIQKEYKTSDDLRLQLEYFEKVTKYRHPNATHQQYAKEAQDYKYPTTSVELQSAATAWKARLEEIQTDNEQSLAALAGLRRYFPAKQQSRIAAGFYSPACSSSSSKDHPSVSGLYNHRSNKKR